MLIAHYSRSNGITERIAKMLQKEVGVDMVKIDTQIPYTGDYDEVVKRWQMDALTKQKEQIEETMDRLSYKISRYEEAMKTGVLTWTKKGE